MNNYILRLFEWDEEKEEAYFQGEKKNSLSGKNVRLSRKGIFWEDFMVIKHLRNFNLLGGGDLKQ